MSERCFALYTLVGSTQHKREQEGAIMATCVLTHLSHVSRQQFLGEDRQRHSGIHRAFQLQRRVFDQSFMLSICHCLQVWTLLRIPARKLNAAGTRCASLKATSGPCALAAKSWSTGKKSVALHSFQIGWGIWLFLSAVFLCWVSGIGEGDVGTEVGYSLQLVLGKTLSYVGQGTGGKS